MNTKIKKNKNNKNIPNIDGRVALFFSVARAECFFFVFFSYVFSSPMDAFFCCILNLRIFFCSNRRLLLLSLCRCVPHDYYKRVSFYIEPDISWGCCLIVLAN